ncbi:MAG: SDR family NAD(P)-dependent oxidoreductase, partial [Clostridia bacterium]|nr:SDR family NAD(P)-dependent oxidoreductase [Clostridia bacterium]
MKYAFVTGAAGGLAGACVEEMMRRGGWTIFAADMNEEGLNTLREKCGDGIIPVVLDITSDESCEKAVELIKQTADHLDVVINAAGIHTMGSLVEGSPLKAIEKMIDINVLGMIRVNLYLFDLIDAAKGRIINFSSECGWEKP